MSCFQPKPKLIVACMPVFSCILHQLHVIAFFSDWLIVPFVSVVIGQSNFGFGFTSLNGKFHVLLVSDP